jgi:hypothetical protein
MSKKNDIDFQQALLRHAKVDEATGELSFDDLYASLYVNICWKGGIISMPVSHVVWFLTHGRWPEDGKVLDHVNDDAMDNAPDNLAELTQEENQRKRRGRKVYRSYGRGKYGPGMNITRDKRDGRYYVRHQASRGHGVGDLKNVKINLGGFATLEEAKIRVTAFLAENGIV